MRRQLPISDDEEDWIEKIVRVAASLGFNEVRVRWKLMGWQQAWEGRKRKAQQELEHVQYEHKVCPFCGALNDRNETRCHHCEEILPSHRWQVLARLGLVSQIGWTVSSLLGGACLLTYARVCWAAPGQGIFDLPLGVLIRFGAHVPILVNIGEWWRLGTALFLHIGIWHLAFNVLALSQVGPLVEKEFGRARVLFLFMVTGILANVGSAYWGLDGVSAGASGAIMGLIGAAAAWGQREGTRVGIFIRDHMVKWAVMVFILGAWIGADNGAHFGGFASGALLGYLLKPSMLRRGKGLAFDRFAAVIGSLLALLAVYLVLFPPVTRATERLLAAWRL
jgi:membrane associated rhomboid family serine protease/ribosomal protein L40E